MYYTCSKQELKKIGLCQGLKISGTALLYQQEVGTTILEKAGERKREKLT
jgi:hypothetical protein